MKPKSEYRRLCAPAKSRATLVEQCRQLAARLNLAFEAYPTPLGDRALTVAFSLPPYRVFATFDGASRVDYFLGHWHTETGSNAKYPQHFGITVRGSMNEYHHAKATTFASTFAEFLQAIEDGFLRLKQGGSQ